MTNLVTYVKKYALDNYEKGWDVVVECYSDADIADIIRGARTEKGAIKKMKDIVVPYNDYRNDIINA